MSAATSFVFTITVGAPTHLVFTTPPSGGPSGVVWATQPVVTIEDSGGNTVTTSTDTVSLAITVGPSANFTCNGGPPSVAASAGVATFSWLSDHRSGGLLHHHCFRPSPLRRDDDRPDHPMSRRPSSERDDRGTSLILALVFVFVIGMVLVAVGGLAANALLNTSNARAQRTSTGDAEAAVTIAMQYLRYNPAPDPASRPRASRRTPPSRPRTPELADDNPFKVVCTLDDSNLAGNARRRLLCLPAGVTSELGCQSSALVLHAQVAYNDLNADGLDDCYTAVPVLVTTSCGTQMNDRLLGRHRRRHLAT